MSDKDSPKGKDTERPVGRPPLEFPAPIPDTPENVAKAMFAVNPKATGFEWDYKKKAADKRGE